MPFTPFHLGPALLVGLLLRDRISLPAILAGSVLVDVRATLVFFGLWGGPVHGPLHTVIGATAVAAVIVAGLAVSRDLVTPVMDAVSLPDTSSLPALAAGAVLGTWSHILLDGVLYTDMAPFAPFMATNPLVVPGITVDIYLGCVIAGIIGLGHYAVIHPASPDIQEVLA